MPGLASSWRNACAIHLRTRDGLLPLRASARHEERQRMTGDREALLERLNGEAQLLRRNVWRALHAAGGGHVGGSLSAADILAALYFHTMNVRPSEPRWADRDRFVLSKGHA